ncbi:MAG: D-glycero-beta-D-manno-heptose 1-phosphate adenylyltransferase [Bacteroidia bacterium]
MGFSKEKIVNREELLRKIAAWREAGDRIVFTNGCFDILHPGHIDNLEKARSLGARLLVGLNSDASVQRLKGPSRPVQPEEVRAQMLAALGCVDAVCLFAEDTPLELIKAVLPDVLAKGGDYQPHEVVGHDVLAAHGGHVVIIPLTPGYSTTDLIKRIKESNQARK